ncbi:kielin/chordin-like protein [Frankliniella occidentalis]|uniref:Kielin/chordin-like protein n=1 Tax=Frankliniella occidentalis TaxID=133901 RepID=A0A6J1SAB6_FRAOC|nr:kielin/chordin-like protein [Frankliniella occidentalis]
MVCGLFVLLAAVAGAQAASTGACDQSACSGDDSGLRRLHHYYSELDCKPVTKPGECCPTSYDCGHMATRDKSVCYFKGKALDVRPDISALDPSACLAGCFCRQTKEAGAVAMLTCAHVECPTLFNPSLIPEGCVATYSTEKCCSDGILCPQNTTAETTKCEWKGKTYLEGEKFYPEEEAPCKTCICQKGFDGTLNGPWCKEVTCGLELHYTNYITKGCAPVFYGKSKCCPIEWRCPADDDVVVAVATSKNPVDPEAPTCKWGPLTLKQGESLVPTPKSGPGPCQRCRCEVPPHVTCATDDGQTCAPDNVPDVAAPEPVPDTTVDATTAAAARSARSITCANVRCVRKCVMVNDEPKCM